MAEQEAKLALRVCLAAQSGEEEVRVPAVEDGDLNWSRMCQAEEIHLWL